MRQRRGAVVVAALALLLVTGCVPGPPSSEEPVDTPRSGGRLPDVRLDALEGEGGVDLGELRGPAVVNLWASWCVPCREELPYYQEFAETYAGEVEVLGIDFRERDTEAAVELARTSGLTYDNVVDPDGLMRAIALPQLILLDERGEIAFAQYLEIDDAAQLGDLVQEHLGVPVPEAAR